MPKNVSPQGCPHHAATTTGSLEDSNYRVAPQSGRGWTPQSGRGLRPKVAVDKLLAHMVFGDKCAGTGLQPLRRGDSRFTLDARRGGAC